MEKNRKAKIIMSSTLLVLLLTSHFTMDRIASSLNKRIISYGQEYDDPNINLVAHRGFSSMYPDNSLEGLVACNKMECIDGVECDVRLTKDYKLVIMHNEFVGFGKVSDYTFDELKEMDLSKSLTGRQTLFQGYNFKEYNVLAKRYEVLEDSTYTLCTLEDFLKVRDKSKVFFLEIKFNGYNDDYLIAKIGELLKGEENVVVQSFSDSNLRRMQELYPDYSYQLIIDSKRGVESIDYIFDAYGIKNGYLEEGTIEDLVNHDKKISIWTINSYKDFSALQEQYGDYNDDIYYISDNPDMIGYQYTKSKG